MTAVADIAPLVNQLREGFQAGVLRTIESRRTQLVQLRRLLTEQEDVLVAALHADLGKPPTESYLTELSFVMNDIDNVTRHLDEWVADEKVRVPVSFRPASARLVREPYGTALIIAPWNYPVQLLFGPLVGALILVPLEEISNSLLGGKGAGLTYVVYGAIIIIIARFLPNGLLALFKVSPRVETKAAGGTNAP